MKITPKKAQNPRSRRQRHISSIRRTKSVLKSDDGIGRKRPPLCSAGK